MKKSLVLIALLHATFADTINNALCPDSCKCDPLHGEHLQVSCDSYDFIKKLLPKQISNIVRLNISNASLVHVDPKLWKLKNIQHLDLSNNHIEKLPSQFPYLPKLKTLNLSSNHLSDFSTDLPAKVQILDVSHNKITHFTRNFRKLTELRFNRNPIDCDCNNLLIYKELSTGVQIPGVLACQTPAELRGKPLEQVNCSIISGLMLGDEAGSGEAELENPNRESIEHLDENEYLLTNLGPTTSTSDPGDSFEEGSGDEGSGAILIPIEPIRPVQEFIPILPAACQFNCSTPKPVGSEDKQDAAPPLGMKDAAKILFDDIMGSLDHDSPAGVKTSSTPELAPVSVPPLLKEDKHEDVKEGEEVNMVRESDKGLVETFPTNVTGLGEMERASVLDENRKSMYIIIGIVITFVVFALIYVVRKKNKRQARLARRQENGVGDEMKPLKDITEKPSFKLEKSLTLEMPTIVEKAPLLNGQNGKVSGEEKAVINIDEDIGGHSDLEDSDDVEIRGHENSELLTPQPERVTIRVSELPDSVPRTPMLVHRQQNTDGEFITTAVSK